MKQIAPGVVLVHENELNFYLQASEDAYMQESDPQDTSKGSEKHDKTERNIRSTARA